MSEELTAFGHINEIIDENGNKTYVDDNKLPFTVVEDLCINGYYYNEHLKNPVRVLHVDKENNRVFFYYRLPFPSKKKRSSNWICYLDKFIEDFKIVPFPKVKQGECENCANVTIEEDFTITHRNRGVVLEINDIYGKWNKKPRLDKKEEEKKARKMSKKDKPGNRKSRQRHNRADKNKKA